MGLRRHVIGASALVLGASVALVGVASTSQASTETPGSAFGLAADGPVAIKPVPAVVSPGGQLARRSLIEQPENAIIVAKALSVAADSQHSQASAADVRTLKDEISAGAISARCEGGQGVSRIANARVAGRPIESKPAPNTTVPVTLEKVGTASVTFNKQVRGADGRLAVTGMAITVPTPGGKTQTIDVAKAMCGTADNGDTSSIDGGVDHGDIGSIDGDTRSTDGVVDDGDDISTAVRDDKVTKEAPAPVPAEVNLPVAG
ncbi:choice-of-anchor P family protein [Streptosporangium sp. KLBMP 9127]|nr:choice-of-anchor P family protein [Streptosporangium sp. KLBMP 9127]